MADTFMNGLSFVRSDVIPSPPEVGFVRLYVKLDGTVWVIDSDGVSTRVTNG